MGKERLSTNGVEITPYSHGNNSHGNKSTLPYIVTPTKISLLWTMGLNIRAKTIKFLEENVGEYLHALGEDKNQKGKNK